MSGSVLLNFDPPARSSTGHITVTLDYSVPLADDIPLVVDELRLLGFRTASTMWRGRRRTTDNDDNGTITITGISFRSDH